MNTVKVYTQSFKDSIENISNRDIDDHEKYTQVCIHFANIMSILLSGQNEIKLSELQQINKLFKDYQESYLN